MVSSSIYDMYIYLQYINVHNTQYSFPNMLTFTSVRKSSNAPFQF